MNTASYIMIGVLILVLIIGCVISPGDIEDDYYDDDGYDDEDYF